MIVLNFDNCAHCSVNLIIVPILVLDVGSSVISNMQ